MSLPKKMLFVDVETANAQRESICALAIVQIEGGETVCERSFLIDPETPFAASCVRVHGIDAADVVGAPKFPDVWQEIAPLMRESLVVAHNAASMDLNAICAAMRRYEIPDERFRYACTLSMARERLPEIKHGLADLCDHFGVALCAHHDPLCDARACWQIFRAMTDMEGLGEGEIGDYRFISPEERYAYAPNPRFTKATLAMQELIRMLDGIMQDGAIDGMEMLRLNDWMQAHRELAAEYPLALVFPAVEAALKDWHISEEEQKELLALFAEICTPVECACEQMDCAFADKSFCLTGDFAYGSNAEVENYIEERCGVVQPGVTKKLDFLVVGSLGSPAWKFGSYGSKVKKALDYQEKGLPVHIITEQELFRERREIDSAAPREIVRTLERLINDLKESMPADAANMEERKLKSGDSSIMFYNQVALRVVHQKAGTRVEIPGADYLEEAQKVSPAAFEKKDAVLIPVGADFDRAAFLQLAGVICEDCREAYPAERFGCCSHFVECSDAGKCLFEGDLNYLGCWYRKNLRAGRIFYGKNANV